MQVHDFFVLRRPTYPISKLAQFYTQLNTQTLEAALRTVYRDPLAQEAIFAASPALYERFQRWLAGDSLPEQPKLLTTLHKYLIRMCSRATPYGLFAGCSLGTFGVQSHLRAGAVAALQAHTRLDIDSLQALVGWLVSRPGLRHRLLLRPNSSVYAVGTSLRYVEQQRDNDKRPYFISAIERTTYLAQVLNAAEAGATITSLARLIAETPTNESLAEAVDFIEQLIDSQLLCFAIEPTLTGSDYLPKLATTIRQLADSEMTENESMPCQAAAQALADLLGYLAEPDRLRAYAGVRQWFADRAIQTPTADVVLVNTFFREPRPALSEAVMRLLQHDLDKLLVLNQPAHRPDLDAFKHRFTNRYEEEEIPLALALDSDFGVGYGAVSTQGVGYAPLIDDLSFGTTTATTTTTWDWWHTLVMDKYAEALRTRQPEMVLTDDDLAQIGRQQPAMPPRPYSFYAFGSLLASSEKALDEGDFRFNLLACAGPSALNLLGRFGEGDPELARQLRASAAAEEAHHPDVIIAEIVHLPENRAGNVLIRPTIHHYEIPYLGQASVPLDHQIPITDLLVSVRQNQVVLRSKRFNRRVIPRLTTAHNFSQGLPIYRFLCDLQAQSAHVQVAWNWGVLNRQTYLPRVRYRRVVVSRATWQLPTSTLAADNPLKLVAQLTAAGLPDQFMLAHADNELLIHLHIPASLDLLIAEIRKTDRIRLVECLHWPDQCPLTNRRDAYAHELILPFRDPTAPRLPGLSQLTGQTGPQRRFSVGSEWFYLKIYAGEKASDALLVQAIYPTVQQLLKTHIIDAFFFVRFQDTDPHLRLRFRGNPHVEFYQYVVRAIEQAFREAVASGVVHRVQVDTYQRELERYGMEQIERCEQLFFYDSLSTLTLLTQTDGAFDEDLRFGVAVAKIDRLLAGLSLPVEARWRLLDRMKEQFFEEFGGESALRRQLNEKYRHHKSTLAQGLAPDFEPVAGLWQWEAHRTTLLAQIAGSIEAEALPILASSLIHMLVNRLFPSKQRLYELVLYHCLAKQYASLKAQQAVVGE